MEEASQPVQKQNPVQTPTGPVKRNFHWIYIFIGVFTLLIISAVFYLGRLSSGQPQQISVSPTPQISKPADETSNWKTYENTKYGYSIKYPSEWLAKEFGPIDSKTLSFIGLGIAVSDPIKASMIIQVTLRSYEEQLQIGPEKTTPITVGGLVGVRKTEGSSNPDAGNNINVVLPAKNTIVLAINEKYSKTFDQILSTFKFTDQNQVDTNSWKTYTNTDYKFTFKYPQDWNLNTPSLVGKHETNQTIFQLNISNTENFKNKALLEENRDVINFTILVWAMGNQSYDQAVNGWYAFKQNPNPPDKVYTKEINQIPWKVEEITFPTNTKLS